MKQRKVIAILAMILVLVLCVGVLAACNKDDERYKATTKTYKTYASSFATSWNVLTYETQDQGEMFSYSSSSFYEFDYARDENGDVIDGKFTVVPTMASDYPTDITAEIAKEENNDFYFTAEDEGYAWYIPVRKGMKWDNGDEIKLDDWIYSMKEQLNPLFQNYRADSYYAGSTVIHNAELYVKQGKYNYVSIMNQYKLDNGIYLDQSKFTEKDGILQYDGKDLAINIKNGNVWGDGLGSNANSFFSYTLTEDGYIQYANAAGDVIVYRKNVDGEANYFTSDKKTRVYRNDSGAFFTDAECTKALEGADKLSAVGTYGPYDDIRKAADNNGYVKLTPALLKNVQDCIAILHKYDNAEAYAADAGDYAYLEWQEMGFYGYDIPEMSFDTVGLRKVDDGERYGLILILDTPYADTDTHFVWAYDFGGNWLVKPDVYESCKVEPSTGSTLYTSTYGTSVATSPSYGPYKLTTYQTGKFYEFTRNENWFGYGIDSLSKGFYETDRIQCTLIEEWDTAWMAFQKGDLSAISIDVKIADTYKTSQRAYFTPDDFVGSLQIQSEASALTDPNDGNAKEILLNNDFRKALSLSIDRAEYARQTTTSSLAGFGLYNSMHYYDVENGGVYRNTDVAKRVICETYGVNVDDYGSLDEAYAAVVGYNLDAAKALVKKAIADEIAKHTIKETDKLIVKMGSSVDSEAARRPYNFLKAAWTTLFEGTQFAGSNFVFEFDGTHGDNYAKDFKSGQYEFLTAGWSGAAWDPFFFMMAYVHPSYRYATGWDASNEMVTVTIPDVGPDGKQGTDDDGTPFTTTMSALNLWAQLYQGVWAEGNLDVEKRLIILGALEKCVLESYYSVPVTYYFSAALRSYQIEAYTDTYNTFMSWGGIKYYHYNYNDGEWARYIDQNNGTLNYK